VADTRGVAVIGPDTIIEGDISGGRMVRVEGGIKGRVAAGHLEVGRAGKVAGEVVAETVAVNGQLEGNVRVKNLIDIRESGRVSGDVRYGALAMAPGADLSADVRNVPPELSGDRTLEVQSGRSALITPEDLQAVDPDDAPEDLTFVVARVTGGALTIKSAPETAVTTFTQADINARRVLFVHDGRTTPTASFLVHVRDDDGATSGVPQTVTVHVSSSPKGARGPGA